MYDYIFFDLDGTLTDSGEGIINGAIYALGKYSIQVKDRTDIHRFIGPPLTYSFEHFYGFSPEEALNAVKIYREYYAKKGIYENYVYDGVEKMLIDLKKVGKKLVVATSKPEFFAEKVLSYFNIRKYFDFVAGSLPDETRGSKAEVIKYALESCGISDMKNVLMVGDREHDVLGAKVFGIDTLGVLYGYGNEEEFKKAGAKFIVASPKEATEKILSFG